ncbi:MAG: TatD family hydrolase [Anaerolineaceae bacterium]
MFCDTHCHLDFDVYDADRQEVVERARAAGIAFIINPGIDLESSQKALQLTLRYPGFIYAAVGIHPNYVGTCAENTLPDLRILAQTPGVVAIGEIGLDYYRHYADPAQQRQVFLQQLELASGMQLPVVIHDRDASQDLVPILTDWYHGLPAESLLKQHPGDLHAYSDNLEIALPLAELGFCFGIGGPITYQNAEERRQVAAGLPPDKILLETDAPFLTPHPYRGKRNEPAYIPLMAAELAKLHGKTDGEIGQITTATAATLFSLKLPGKPA